jgi:hypothetical protein
MGGYFHPFTIRLVSLKMSFLFPSRLLPSPCGVTSHALNDTMEMF